MLLSTRARVQAQASSSRTCLPSILKLCEQMQRVSIGATTAITGGDGTDIADKCLHSIDIVPELFAELFLCPYTHTYDATVAEYRQKWRYSISCITMWC